MGARRIYCAGPGHTVFLKVTAHATAAHLSSRVINKKHCIGNPLADTYAYKGADLHAVPDRVVCAIGMQRAKAVNVRKRLVSVLERCVVFHRTPRDTDDTEPTHFKTFGPHGVLRTVCQSQ
jgi:N-acetylglutamate synthase/N-acetylornithine aminotransferase